VFYNYRVPYITITPTFSICPKHGYIPGAHEYCPYCDEELANGEDGGDSHEGETIPPNIEFKINL
jgi:ribonucleoside-triphosphate reductase